MEKIFPFLSALSIMFIAGMFIGVEIGSVLQERKLRKKLLNAENIVECFKDCDWVTHTFSGNSGALMETADGAKHFYKAAPIDAAIAKLNKLIKDSWET